jgi:D-alanine-D-alanine ligase
VTVLERATMSPATETATPLPDRVRLVVLFGGRSPEHDVSRVSAREVIAALDLGRYDVVPVAIDRDGRWLTADATRAALADGRPLPPALAASGTEIDPLSVLRADIGMPVVVLPVLHGPNGEDGTVQGLLELADVPYVGSGVLGSSLSMDKAKAKEVLAAAGIPQARHVSVNRWELSERCLADIAADLGLPLFVKPANMGSSIGVARVADVAQLPAAVAAALAHDDWLVFEEAVTGRELEMGVIGTTHPRTSVPGEVVPGADFYDYDDKYTNGVASIDIPAVLPDGVAEQMADLAVRTFRALRADVLARVDFFYEADGRGLLVNELNTLPGCTPVSMFPSLWEATGLPYAAMLDELVRLALERHTRRAHDRRAAAEVPE